MQKAQRAAAAAVAAAAAPTLARPSRAAAVAANARLASSATPASPLAAAAASDVPEANGRAKAKATSPSRSAVAAAPKGVALARALTRDPPVRKAAKARGAVAAAAKAAAAAGGETDPAPEDAEPAAAAAAAAAKPPAAAADGSVAFASAAAFDAWLRVNHATQDGVWARLAKRASGIPSLTAEEAVPIALCWGWIDAQRKGLDDTWFLQRYTPRRARSRWSQVNVGHVERLTAAGRMQPAGLAQVAAAKADGRWAAAYSSMSSRTVPAELQAALDGNARAAAAFAALSSSNRWAFCLRVETSKRAKTKQRHVERAIEMLERGETYH